MSNYIAQCPQCGAYCAAVVNDAAHKQDVAREVAGYVKRGLLITAVDDDFVREHFARCTCKARGEGDARQLELGI